MIRISPSLQRCRPCRQRSAFQALAFTIPEPSPLQSLRLPGVSNHRKDVLKMKHACCGITCFPLAIRQTIQSDDSANYPRRELGGARPAYKSQGLACSAKYEIQTLSSPVTAVCSSTALANSAGGPGSRFAQTECFSAAACRTVRLLVADSSISARIACRSSVAEITGNSSTSAHPRASTYCSALTLRDNRAPAPWRHNQ